MLSRITIGVGCGASKAISKPILIFMSQLSLLRHLRLLCGEPPGWPKIWAISSDERSENWYDLFPSRSMRGLPQQFLNVRERRDRRSYPCVTMQVDASPRASTISMCRNKISKGYCVGYLD